MSLQLIAAYTRIRLLCFGSTSAFVRVNLSALVSTDMIKDPFVVGAREDRTIVLDLLRA